MDIKNKVLYLNSASIETKEVQDDEGGSLYIEGYASEKYWTPLQAGCQLEHRIGWTPDYKLSDCDEPGWAKQVVEHVKEVSK